MEFITEVKVRFSETDMAGHVNNTSYFVYLEDARINFLDKALPDYKGRFIAASIKCDYIRQVYYRQYLVIKTNIARIGNKSLELKHEMFEKESGQLVARGQSVEVHFDFDQQVSVPISGDMRKHLEQF